MLWLFTVQREERHGICTACRLVDKRQEGSASPRAQVESYDCCKIILDEEELYGVVPDRWRVVEDAVALAEDVSDR